MRTPRVALRRDRHHRRPGSGTRACGAAAVVLSLALAACGSGSAPRNAARLSSGADPGVSAQEAPASSGGRPAPAATASPAAKVRAGGGTAVLAFAGDVHFEGSAGAALRGRLGSAFSVLRSADLAVVNLETAITDRGTAQPKEFTFRAPAAAVGVLKGAGVDAVSIANNHGMDYGQVGLADTLAAGRRYGMPILGAGTDDTKAWQPLRTEVKGVRVSVVAATDVLDDFARTTWVARPGVPGLATAKDTPRLLATVRAERSRADVVVVFLHWGLERSVCPTARQRDLARQLAGAGADIVVGSHAHVVSPGATIGSTLVRYGMGNFQFYVGGGGVQAQSGVLTVPVTRAGAGAGVWHPATIAAGAPMLMTGAAASARAADETRRFAACG